MNAYISGIGWVFPTSSGNRTDTFHHKNKKSSLPGLTRKDVLKQPYKPFGRMDFFSKLGFAAISYALMDSGLDKKEYNKNTAIIASTVLGCLETDINYYKTVIQDKGKRASPALFAYTLPNCFLGEASIYYGFIGESFIINEEKTSGLHGLSMVLDLLETGVSDTVLCGVCDTEKQVMDDLLENIIPGAIFFVLENEKREDVFYYGKVKKTIKENIILYNDNVISDLVTLGEKCLGIKFS